MPARNSPAPLGLQIETITEPQSGPKPTQAGCFTLLFLARGHTRWTIDTRRHDLRPGTLCLLRPGQMFNGIESSSGVPIEVQRISVNILTRLSTDLITKAFGVSRADANSIKTHLSADLSQTFDLDENESWLLNSMSTEGKLQETHQRAVMWCLLTKLATRTSQSSSITRYRTLSSAEHSVLSVLEALERRCDEDWTLEMIAELGGLKRTRFGTICRQLTGESPINYLNRLRIRRARDLLCNTNRTVTDIAFDCGFSSSQYFAKMFRRFQGHEPTHYRQLAREIASDEGVRFIKGSSPRTIAIAETKIDAGDFSITGKLTLERLGDTAASLEFGPDRFGFDGSDGRFFVEGETFGEAKLFQRSLEVIREGIPFSFKIERRKRQLKIVVEGEQITTLEDDPNRKLGQIGVRPMRNAIRIHHLAINDQNTALTDVS